MTQAEQLKKYMEVLRGGTILDVGVIEEDDGFGFIDDFMAFTVRATDGKIYQCEVLCDPEGNGAGFLEIGER